MSEPTPATTSEVPSGSGPRIHIDETAGSDATGTGTAEAPYQSPAHAWFIHGSSTSVELLILKPETKEYTSISPSALKKAKKGAESLEKKKKKAEEQRVQDELEKEKQLKKLEESKKVVITEDSSLPKAVRVSELSV